MVSRAAIAIRKAVAIEAAEHLKRKHPNSEVVVKDLRSGKATVVAYYKFRPSAEWLARIGQITLERTRPARIEQPVTSKSRNRRVARDGFVYRGPKAEGLSALESANQ
jgi:hypothetical protein